MQAINLSNLKFGDRIIGLVLVSLDDKRYKNGLGIYGGKNDGPQIITAGFEQTTKLHFIFIKIIIINNNFRTPRLSSMESASYNLEKI